MAQVVLVEAIDRVMPVLPSEELCRASRICFMMIRVNSKRRSLRHLTNNEINSNGHNRCVISRRISKGMYKLSRYSSTKLWSIATLKTLSRDQSIP
jgi:hypothetical protein